MKSDDAVGPERDARARGKEGVAYGLAAYGLWGAVPIFWPLVRAASATEILAHRIIWSLVICVVLLLTVVRGRSLRAFWGRVANRRTLLLLGVAAAIVSLNWGTYIWSVNHGHVVDTALGYYINPILSILIGVVVLRERLSPLQWTCVALAALAVVVLTVDYGRPPWIALTLATSFAIYGAIKKQVNGGAVDTLTVESGLLTPIAIGYLVVLQVSGGLTFGHLGVAHSLLLAASGVVTVVPLLFFAASATRLPLSTLGLLQYIAPTLQFGLGILYFHEVMSTERWVGFGLVWLALVVLTVDGVRRARRSRRRRAVPQPVAEPV